MSEVIVIKELKYGIKILTRSRGHSDAYIYARSRTIWGYIILRVRGYKPHNTIFGVILRKNVTKKKVEKSGIKWVKWYL